MNSATTGHVRLTVNVSAELKRRIRLVCTRRQLSMREYLTIVLEERLANDLTPTQEGGSLLALTAQADPVLAELWGNAKDAVYDRL